jgi:hypothetical protein
VVSLVRESGAERLAAPNIKLTCPAATYAAYTSNQ